MFPTVDETPTVGEIIEESIEFLNSVGRAEPLANTQWLLSYLLKLSKTELSLQHKRILTPKEMATLHQWLSRCATGEPVQYITGETEFFGLRFQLTKDVLIPRPETERLVEIVIDISSGSELVSILDIGTGCGCLAISLAHHCPEALVMAIDESVAALELASRNSEINGIANQINFVKLDILNESPINKFNLVVTNPPYITLNEYESLDNSVKFFEPYGALTDGYDGLTFYRRFAVKGKEWLASGGFILMEVGRNNHPQLAAELFNSAGWKAVELLPDYNGDLRILKASRP